MSVAFPHVTLRKSIKHIDGPVDQLGIETGSSPESGKTEPSKIEKTYTIKKTADSVLLSLFMRPNGKCNNSHAPSISLSGILLSVRTQYSQRTRIKKNINTISMHGEKFYQLHIETTPSRVAQSVTCLATDAYLTGREFDPGPVPYFRGD